MPQLSRTALKLFFETGDIPTQSEFSDLIDSYFNFTDDTFPTASASGLLSNLFIENQGLTLINISADVITIQGPTQINYTATLDINGSGAGGLDTGATAANSRYYIFAITDNAGGITNSLMSLSRTAPTLPPTFTKFRYIGFVTTNAIPQLIPFSQIGNKYGYRDFTQQNILINGISTTFTNIGTGNFLPNNTKRAKFILIISASFGTSGFAAFAFLRHPSGFHPQGQLLNSVFIETVGQQYESVVIGDCDVNPPLTVDYLINTLPGFGGVTIYITGFDLQI